MITRRRMAFGLAGLLCLGLPGAASVPVLAGPADGDSGATVTIATRSGDLAFRVEIADTPEARQRGLMFRESLDDDEGMLFLFDPPTPVVMWMKDTPISLDMLFIDAAGQIVRIAARTVPQSTTAIPAGQPVRAVLELSGGAAGRFGIREGDRVHFTAGAGGETR